MIRDLKKKMNDVAYTVLGARSWDRDRKNLHVKIAIENAETFLDEVHGRMGDPYIGPGHTADPGIVLRLHWRLKALTGVHVRFHDDDTCSVEWAKSINDSAKVTGMSIHELLDYNVPEKFKAIFPHAAGPKKGAAP